MNDLERATRGRRDVCAVNIIFKNVGNWSRFLFRNGVVGDELDLLFVAHTNLLLQKKIMKATKRPEIWLRKWKRFSVDLTVLKFISIIQDRASSHGVFIFFGLKTQVLNFSSIHLFCLEKR